VLCDSDDSVQYSPLRAVVVEATLAREGRSKDYPMLETMALTVSPYHHLMHERYPDRIPLIIPPGQEGSVSPLAILYLLDSLSKSNTLCYLHPSGGYYFETFYQEAHGLAYPLKLLSTNTLVPPPLAADRIVENEVFWDKAVASLLPSVQSALNPTDYKKEKGPVNWLLMHLHATSEANQNGLLVGLYVSRSLNEWGVELQRAGELSKAAVRFQQAVQFNPDNVAAQNNLAFNAELSTNAPIIINAANVTPDQFGRFRSWNEVVTADGPFDDPSFRFVNGYELMGTAFFRQAAYEFTRVVQLAPGNLAARLQLVQIYLLNHLPDQAMEFLREPLAAPDKFGVNADTSTYLNMMVAAIKFQQNKPDEGARLLEAEVARHPNDEILATTAAQTLFSHGLYTNALRVIEGRLAQAPDNPTWLFGKGYAYFQIGDYGDAIKPMTRVLDIQTNNDAARFDRALAYLRSDQLDSARADYAALQATYTNSFQIAFGLGQIAWQQKDNAGALRNYRIYLVNAPTNTLEYSNIAERVQSLKR
jgi:Flp pilus assembly protein TadD